MPPSRTILTEKLLACEKTVGEAEGDRVKVVGLREGLVDGAALHAAETSKVASCRVICWKPPAKSIKKVALPSLPGAVHSAEENPVVDCKILCDFVEHLFSLVTVPISA